MGPLKPLLSLGGMHAVERVITNLRSAGVGDIVVVTGHEAGRVAPVVESAGATQVHNPGYDSGMFSSVRAGVAALPEYLDAFFVQPADCALVTPRALRALVAGFAGADHGIVYPTCLGHRGHPPLLSSRYVRPLLDYDPDGTLAAFLGGFPDDQAEIDVRDLTVLMDMDMPGDYHVLTTFAAALDAAASGGPEPSLGETEALFLLAVACTPANIVRHCRTAAAVGERFAALLLPHVPDLDVDLVRAGCLLHDIARVLPNHAQLAKEVLANLGLPRLGAVVGRHMIIEPGLPRAAGVTEAELVYLADKMVADGEVVGLDERQARAGRKLRSDPEAVQRIGGRMDDARLIAGKISAILARPADEVLEGLELPAACAPGELLVYLVRHACPEAAGGRRYHGQGDAPLGPEGERQARELTNRLMALMGGACFDAIISSDLRRSSRTAEIIAEACRTRVQTVPWLREVDVGLWEDLTWEEARCRHPAEHAAREDDLVRTRFPRGESFADVAARAVPPFERLIEQSGAAGLRRVLVVGHKGVNRVLLAHVRGLALGDIFTIEQELCAITLLRVSGSESGVWRVTAVEPRR
jgi:broad specificity phosphatase PhoE/CTP:molybdopterin cytidylyltransferase MocA